MCDVLGQAILALVLTAQWLSFAVDASAVNCSQEVKCGWKGICRGGQCECPTGYKLHKNNLDCLKANCSQEDCLECDSGQQCIRCVNFIVKETRKCLQTCTGQAEISQSKDLLGNVCSENGSDNSEVIIAVVAGVAAGLLLCVIITLIIIFYMRRTRKNVNLQETHYHSKEMEMGKVKHIPVYDNKGFEMDNQVGVRHSVIDPEIYMQELEQLRPHTETLMTVLGQIRRRLRAMDSNDPRVPTYKGVIHQLCRVLVLLHRKDSPTSIPSDALGLIEWAQQMLEDHREQQELEQSSSVSASDVPVSKISYIDVDFETPGNNRNVYATPAVGQEPFLSHSGDTSGYYSSVPVPVDMNNGGGGGGGYATVSRTLSNPGNNNNKTPSAKPGTTKKSNNGNKSKTFAGTGYFANGRYYDPNPDPQPEVYAPASSYSDRSGGAFMTFRADTPPSLSASSSSSVGTKDELDDDKPSEDIDLFPFDPQDATDPVEV